MEDHTERYLIEQKVENFLKAQQTLKGLNQIRESQEVNKIGDIEGDHVKADGLLVDFVLYLGFTEIVEAYESIGKWYA
jgi:hypothetical protein